MMPCPFCGSTDVFVQLGVVECRDCEATGPSKRIGTDEQAVAAWNKRVERSFPDPAVAE